MKRLNISGDVVSNDYGDAYEWYGWDYASPKNARDIIDSLEDGEELQIHINSGGGHVFAGLEIYSAIRELKNTTAYIESLAASAASIIAMGCNKILISPTALMMIHNVSTVAIGDHTELEKTAKDLREMDKALSNAYAEKTGMDRDEILKLMGKESWFASDKCIELGLANGLIERPQQYAAGTLRMSLEQFEIYKNRKRMSEAEKLALELL